MLLGQSNSSNFINALNIIMKHNNKRIYSFLEKFSSIKIEEIKNKYSVVENNYLSKNYIKLSKFKKY